MQSNSDTYGEDDERWKWNFQQWRMKVRGFDVVLRSTRYVVWDRCSTMPAWPHWPKILRASQIDSLSYVRRTFHSWVAGQTDSLLDSCVERRVVIFLFSMIMHTTLSWYSRREGHEHVAETISSESSLEDYLVVGFYNSQFIIMHAPHPLE